MTTNPEHADDLADDLVGDLADLESIPKLVPVIIQVHNGLVVDGKPMFVPSVYKVPIRELWEVQKRWAAFEIPT